MQPEHVHFQSPDHNSTYANGALKVTHYRVGVSNTDNPASLVAQELFDKASAVPDGSNFKLPLNAVMLQLPGDYFGFMFVRAENPMEVGAYGVGMSFLKSVAPAACNVVAIV